MLFYIKFTIKDKKDKGIKDKLYFNYKKLNY
jgi:hypothetical protein